MRDDEDHIRQFMPVLRRIVILVAVLTAIPVAMWTITAFVRTYVGPPKTPTFQRIADTPPNASAAAPAANATTVAAQTSPAPIVEAKATATDADANAPMTDSNAAAPADAAANAAPTNTMPADPAFPNVTAPNAPPAPAPMGQTAAATNDAASANAPSAGTAPGAAGTADSAAPTAPAYAAPNDAPGGMQVAAQQPAPTNWPTSQPPAVESQLPGEPIAGLVPLPRKRPKTFVLAQGGPIPLPTARPEVAGEGAPQPQATPFDWLQRVFHAASDHAGSDGSAQQ